MSRSALTFRQSDLTRALKAAEAAGKDVAGVRFDRHGKPVIIFGKPVKPQSDNEWDDVYESPPA